MAKVWISQKLFDDMLADVEEYLPLETGGSFFGYTSDSNDVVITHLIDAGPRAKRTKFSFEPDQDFQLPEMERLFYKHKGSVRYLGDWHSHPCSSPALSRRDEKTLLNVALSDEAQCPHPIMMIIGSFQGEWSFNCVRFKQGRKILWPFFSCEYEKSTVIVD